MNTLTETNHFYKNETIQAAKIILSYGNKKKITKNVKALDDHIDVAIKSQVISFIPNFFRPVALLAVIISLFISLM